MEEHGLLVKKPRNVCKEEERTGRRENRSIRISFSDEPKNYTDPTNKYRHICTITLRAKNHSKTTYTYTSIHVKRVSKASNSYASR